MVGGFSGQGTARFDPNGLKNNYDVRIAATRVLQAQAQLGITRADQFPTVSGGGNIASQQSPKIGPIPGYEITQGELTASAAWNLDFWGGTAALPKRPERTCWRMSGLKKK